uniref:Kinase non-catalytic C-lobe domain containing 1 n=1 Tax=Cyanistes caeruleus TaxID=156563 RepID=A0A8C0VJZ1_CYACU
FSVTQLLVCVALVIQASQMQVSVFSMLPSLPSLQRPCLENVSLADILSLRDSCLTEQDIWAICLECCHSLKSIAHSAIFQTLCITPDTLAFNTNGNVCFMEQLSDDPEGAFVPPEFDITGNTFEAHIYSLGATLKAAIEYIVEPETESEFGQDLHTLLEQMQEENPENRPDIESILSLCEEKMKIASSSNICRSLSAVGRRVLSIESFGASQGNLKISLGSKLYSNEKSNIVGDSSAVEEVTTACHNNSSVVTMVTGRESRLKEMQIDLDNEKTQHSQLATQTEKSKEEDKHAVYTDSFASVALDIKSCVIDLERDGLFKKGSLRKMKTFPKLPLELTDTNNFFTSVSNSGPLDRKNHFVTQESLPLDNNNEVAFSKGNLNSLAVSSPPETESKNHQVDDHHLEAPCVCTQWISLKLLLSWYGRPLKDYELWALCHECLCTLQTCKIRHYMLKSYDVFYLAPEIEEEDVDTEKVCVYGVAAVLWMAAKYSVPLSHKLVLPRKFKKLLLDMARKNPEERPSLTAAIKVIRLIVSKVSFYLGFNKHEMDPSTSSLGFVPCTSDSKLVAVKGPVPCQISLNCEKATFPVAFTSPATHFKPIILQQDANITKLCDLQVPSHSSQMSSEEQNSGNTFTSTVRVPSPSDSSHVLQEKSILSDNPSSSSACPTSPNFLHINNIILKQNSEKRVLTFVPVHLAVSEQIPNKPLRSRIAYDCYHSLPVLLSNTIASYKMSMQFDESSSVIQTSCQETECATSTDSFFTEQEHTPCTSVDKDSYNFFDDKALPHQSTPSDTLLQEVIHLIQEEFAFDGYLENGTEVFDMGNFILNLKEIKFGMFSDRICEKFCDLYWDEKLLENLYQAVNGGRPSHLWYKSESFLTSSDQTEGEKGLHAESIKTSLVDMDFDGSPLDNIKKELALQSTIPIAKEQQYLQSNGCAPGFAEESTNSEEQDMIKIAGNSYLTSPNLPDFCGCSPGWSSAFYGAECFDSEVHSYLKNLGKQKSSESQNIDAKKVELEQLLMIETKNYRKTIKFYQKLLQKERRSKGPETKSMLPKLRGQLQEMKSKVQFLELVKKYVQMMYAEQWGVESYVLPTVIHSGKADTMDMAPVDESSLLLYYNTEKHQCNNQNGGRVLQAGTPLGLMAYLYSRNAFLEGYVQQFLYTFRYFCTQEEFLKFLLDRISNTLSSASLDPSTSLTKICNRSFYILQAWIEDCYSVDFATNTDLLGTLKEFISSKVASLNGYGERLLSLLEDASARKSGSADLSSGVEKCEEESQEGRKTLHSLCKKLSEDVSRKNFYWKLSKGVGPIAQHQRERLHSGSAVLPKPCCSSFTAESSVSLARADEVGPVLLIECSAQQLCWQLTLLQQEVFNKCHPVHFLNSRALGVKDKCVAVPKAVSAETVSLKVCNLFLSKCIQDRYLLQLLKNADSISTWVAAEIVTCHTAKRQVSLLSKFLLIAKCCYEQRNFATAMQILAGLENLIVRQLPAWKILPAKVAEIMEELKAVEVFLKSDSLCLMEGDRFKTLPTIPSAHVLAMHVQQLETGGFTMTNGAHKWTKLRNIAKVVSQVHAFQENPYTYAPDFKLQSYLRQRVTRFKDADISALAADNCANFHQIPAEKHSRKIQDTLRRMKATFQ